MLYFNSNKTTTPEKKRNEKKKKMKCELFMSKKIPSIFPIIRFIFDFLLESKKQIWEVHKIENRRRRKKNNVSITTSSVPFFTIEWEMKGKHRHADLQSEPKRLCWWKCVLNLHKCNIKVLWLTTKEDKGRESGNESEIVTKYGKWKIKLCNYMYVYVGTYSIYVVAQLLNGLHRTYEMLSSYF